MEHGAHGPARLGEGEGVLDLPEDLRLAQDHRVETGGDPEGVLHRLHPAMRVEQRLEGGEPDAPLRAHLAKRGAPRLARHVGDAVDLDAVAGGEDHDLRARPAADEIAHDLAQLVLVEGELLAHGEGRRVVGEPGHEETLHHEPCRPWKITPAPSVASSTQKPTMAK